MKKFTATFLALTMACGMLAGCGELPALPGEESQNSSQPAESSAAAAAPEGETEFDGVTVKVWGGDLLNNP